MKWGSRYGHEYVNRLYKSIKKHTKRPTNFIVLLIILLVLIKNIICKPLPKISLPETIAYTPWRKMSLWQYPLYDLKGDVLFLDLDLVITGNLDRFFDFKPGFYCVIENWTQLGQNIGNTSCFRFPVGKYASIFEDFQKNPQNIGKNII